MHKEAAPDWGQAVPVDYVSRMGQVWTLYGGFSRPLLRRPHWEVDYALNFGVGMASRFYNRHNNVDNELLGSRWNILFWCWSSRFLLVFAALGDAVGHGISSP